MAIAVNSNVLKQVNGKGIALQILRMLLDIRFGPRDVLIDNCRVARTDFSEWFRVG